MEPKIAFIVWNSFQILHFKPLLRAFPNALLVIEKRKRSTPIKRDVLRDILNNIAYIDQNRIHEKLDGFFDIIVTQTVFEQLYLFRKTKVAMLQYGYAKEPHNYGTWRSLADLNLVYGQYAYDRMVSFSPTQITGCPRYDNFFTEDNKKHATDLYGHICNPNKKTILYAPSWGDLCSFSLYIKEISKLATKYNVLIKLHHNTILLTDQKIKELKNTNLHFFYENDDLLALIAVSDIVISDFSGAIFDAIYCKKPVVLLSIPNINSLKLDNFSLEIAHRDKLGYEVEHPKQLASVIQFALREQFKVDSILYRQLYFMTTSATDNVKKYLIALAKGEYKLTQTQAYIRQTVRELYIEKLKQKQIRKKRLVKLVKLRKVSNRFFKNK